MSGLFGFSLLDCINNLKALGLKEMNLKLIEEAHNKEQAEVGVLKENFECLVRVATKLDIEFDSISEINDKKSANTSFPSFLKIIKSIGGQIN